MSSFIDKVPGDIGEVIFVSDVQSSVDIQYRNMYCLFMKTTLDINSSLLQNAKALAAQQHTSLTQLIEEGLQLRLRVANTSLNRSETPPPLIPVYPGKNGLVSRVNPLSNKAMLDAMDSSEPQ